MSTQKLSTLAKTIRSKNAGVNKITFDIIFQSLGGIILRPQLFAI